MTDAPTEADGGVRLRDGAFVDGVTGARDVSADAGTALDVKALVGPGIEIAEGADHGELRDVEVVGARVRVVRLHLDVLPFAGSFRL